jgi:hypothetical protein
MVFPHPYVNSRIGITSTIARERVEGFIGPPLFIVVFGLPLLIIATASPRSPGSLLSRSSDLRMGFSQTFQILSRCGIVLRELPGATDPVRLRAEETLIPDGALGK